MQNLGRLFRNAEKIADIGFKAVQISGTCPYEGTWLKKELDKNGLIAPVTHISFKTLTQQPKETLELHRDFSCNRIGIGSAPVRFNDENINWFIREITSVIQYLSENGTKFYYHNHWQEFVRSEKDGEHFIDKICNAFPPHQLGIILDTYWVQFAGADPIYWIKKFQGRLDCVHFKDMICKDHEHFMMPVGEGNLNWEGIVSACEDAGTKYAFVEQDNCNGEDPFLCLNRSYNYLKSIGLE